MLRNYIYCAAEKCVDIHYFNAWTLKCETLGNNTDLDKFISKFDPSGIFHKNDSNFAYSSTICIPHKKVRVFVLNCSRYSAYSWDKADCNCQYLPTVDSCKDKNCLIHHRICVSHMRCLTKCSEICKDYSKEFNLSVALGIRRHNRFDHIGAKNSIEPNLSRQKKIFTKNPHNLIFIWELHPEIVKELQYTEYEYLIDLSYKSKHSYFMGMNLFDLNFKYN